MPQFIVTLQSLLEYAKAAVAASRPLATNPRWTPLSIQTQEQGFKPRNSAHVPQVQQLQADANNKGYSDLWCTWTPGSNVQYRVLRPALLRAGAAAAGGCDKGGLRHCGAH